MLRDDLHLAAVNLLRGKCRTLLTGVAIAVGIASVVLLTAIGESGRQLIRNRLESVGINGIMVFSGEYDGLTINDAQRILARVPEVTAVMPFETCIAYYSAHGRKTANAVLIGVDQQVTDYMTMDILHGRLFNAAECESGSAVCVVGEDFAVKEFGRKNVVGKTISVSLDGGSGQEFRIIGVVRSTLNELSGMIGVQLPCFLYVPYSVVTDGANVAQLVVHVRETADPSSVTTRISSLLKRTNVNGKYFSVENMSGYMSEFDGILSVVTSALSATAAISLLVAGIGVMNSMMSTVADRKSEIGICKAIGATSLQICSVFLTETLLLCAVSGFVGLVFGFGISALVFALVGVPMTLNASELLVPTLLTLAVGILSGLVPAIAASRLQPIRAIQKE